MRVIFSRRHRAGDYRLIAAAALPVARGLPAVGLGCDRAGGRCERAQGGEHHGGAADPSAALATTRGNRDDSNERPEGTRVRDDATGSRMQEVWYISGTPSGKMASRESPCMARRSSASPAGRTCPSFMKSA